MQIISMGYNPSPITRVVVTLVGHINFFLDGLRDKTCLE